MAKEDAIFTVSLTGLAAGTLALSCLGAAIAGTEGGTVGMGAYAVILAVTSVLGFLLGSSLFGGEERHAALWTALAALVMAFFLIVYGGNLADLLKGVIVLGVGIGMTGSAAASFYEHLRSMLAKEHLVVEK